MNNKIKNLLLIVSIAFSLSSCYEDLGNYDYHEINEVEIEIPKTSVRLPKAGETAMVEIIPEISQTILQNEEHLEYLWEKGPENIQFTKDYVEIGTEKNCRFEVLPEDDYNISIRLTVTDNQTGLKWYQVGKVTVVMPFSSTWFVLQEKNGTGILGVADGDLEASVILPDVFKEELGATFPLHGKPFRLTTYHNYGLNHIFVKNPMKPIVAIATDKDMWIMDAAKLTKIWEANNMFLYPVRETPNIQRNITALKQSKAGEMAIDNGNLYWSFMDGYGVFYRVGCTEENEDMEATHFTEYNSGNRYMVYDKKYHRFMYFSIDHSMIGDAMNIARNNPYVRNPTSTGHLSTHKKLRCFGNNGYVFNPDNIAEIDPSIEVLEMIRTANHAMAMATTPGSSEVKVLEFGVNGAVTGLYSFTAPDGLKAEDLYFCTSYVYNRIFFAAAKNKVYKIELQGAEGRVSTIYEHLDANANIAGIKFKNEEMVSWEPVPTNYILGASVNNGEEGSLVELNLTLAGDVRRDENAIHEYKGFDKIVDFAYSYQDQ